ncbi:MAG: ABC transporter permease [Nitrospirales bacterium]|nr:ABC transporter permease [Nitrospirales bacterium]
MTTSQNAQESITIIKPSVGWQVSDFKELKEYQDLFFFLVWRDIKVIYAQTIFGFAWAIFNPLVQIVVFTVIFGNIAKLSTDGIPYILFSTLGVIPWTYMSQAMTGASQSLVSGKSMLGKIYFPRLIFPLSTLFSKLLDFVISMGIVVCVLLYFRVSPTWNLAYLPLFFIMMVLIPAGVGLWFSSLALRFRDVRFIMQFLMQMLMYSAPIVYSASSIPDVYRVIYSLNPIVGVIEGYRACLLGLPIQWIYIWPGMIIAVIIFISGAIYFKRTEYLMVDVI